MPALKIDIVVPCLNEEKYIDACLESILAQDYPQEFIQTFVVDGRSEDGTRAKIQAWEKRSAGKIQMLDNPARHTPKALNLGIEAAKGDVLIILGAHAKLHVDFCARNARILQEMPEVACAGGVINNIHENHSAAIISKAMSSPFGVGNARFRTGGEAGFVDTVAFGAYRRSVLDEVGYFDEDLVRNQDDELNFRITEAGHKIYFDPKIQSDYYVRASFKKLFKQYRQYGYWKVFVNKKHRKITTLRQLIPFLLVMYSVLGFILWLTPKIFVFWSLGMLFYVCAAMLSAMLLSKKVKEVLQLIFVFGILHFSYGWGYAEGIFEFLILGKAPKSSQLKLTR